MIIHVYTVSKWRVELMYTGVSVGLQPTGNLVLCEHFWDIICSVLIVYE